MYSPPRRRHLTCFGEPPKTKLTSILCGTVLERSASFNVADALGSVIENVLETFGATVHNEPPKTKLTSIWLATAIG